MFLSVPPPNAVPLSPKGDATVTLSKFSVIAVLPSTPGFCWVNNKVVDVGWEHTIVPLWPLACSIHCCNVSITVAAPLDCWNCKDAILSAPFAVYVFGVPNESVITIVWSTAGTPVAVINTVALSLPAPIAIGELVAAANV